MGNEFNAAALGMARQAFAKEGAIAFLSTRRTAAFHEAGHAVVFAAEGIPVRTVRIFRDHSSYGQSWSGRTVEVDAREWRSDSLTPPAKDLRRARVIIAGALAEKI